MTLYTELGVGQKQICPHLLLNALHCIAMTVTLGLLRDPQIGLVTLVTESSNEQLVKPST